MDSWDNELSADERDRIIDKLAAGVIRRGLAMPAILLLEMHKPLTFLTSQSLIVASPFVAPLVGLGNVQTASRMLGKRENVEMLIRRIEDLDAAAQTEKRGDGT